MEGILGLSYEQFAEYSLNLGIGSLIFFMVFIMYRLARESRAGQFGTIMIFISLGLGLIGFMVKAIIQLTLNI